MESESERVNMDFNQTIQRLMECQVINSKLMK